MLVRRLKYETESAITAFAFLVPRGNQVQRRNLASPGKKNLLKHGFQVPRDVTVDSARSFAKLLI